MRIETPHGSGNYIDIYYAPCGDLIVSITTTDSTGFKSRSAIEMLGMGKGENEPSDVSLLHSVLQPFAD